MRRGRALAGWTGEEPANQQKWSKDMPHRNRRRSSPRSSKTARLNHHGRFGPPPIMKFLAGAVRSPPLRVDFHGKIFAGGGPSLANNTPIISVNKGYRDEFYEKNHPGARPCDEKNPPRVRSANYRGAFIAAVALVMVCRS
jgi:hypothetical protein